MNRERILLRRSWIALGSALLVSAALAVSSGCHSQPQASYDPPPELDDDFEKAANRPPTAETLYRLARLLAAEHKDAEAERVLLGAIERYPMYMPLYNELAEVYIRQRKVDAAISTLNEGLAVVSNDAVTLNNLGMSHMLKQDYEAALQAFTRATAADRDNARYVANMALAAGMLGRYDESLALYEQVMRPGQAHYNVAVVAEARDDMDRANAEYAMALQLDPWLIQKNDDYKGGLQQRKAR
jgi:tetratricopeptide (TPR) repeat protein